MIMMLHSLAHHTYYNFGIYSDKKLLCSLKRTQLILIMLKKAPYILTTFLNYQKICLAIGTDILNKHKNLRLGLPKE